MQSFRVYLFVLHGVSALDNGVALTPPMGWSTWNRLKCNFDAVKLLDVADHLWSSGMVAAGYKTLNIDDCWPLRSRDVHGRIVPDPTRFPYGMKNFSMELNRRGLTLGIYTSHEPLTCQKFPGSFGHEEQDAKDYAQWGVTFVKNDWCKSELQENEMATMKEKDLKADLEAKSGELESTIKTLSEEIEKAKLDIDNLNMELQRASENRKKENLDFQKVVADQMVTAEILAKALDKLATFYDEAAFTQTKANKQTPPVPQMEYKKSAGASGVMSMIEKLIYDTKDITAESKKSESEAQAAYEALVADTNESIADLTKEITSKTKAKAQAKKDLSATQSDLADSVTELENLGKYNADLHSECDYVMKNFGIRQKARAEEIEALQQAKQILNGANLS